MFRLIALVAVGVFVSACNPPQSNTPQSNTPASSAGNATGTAVAQQETITLKLAHGWPKGFPLFGQSVEDYAELVKSLSDGRIQISVDSTNKHKSSFGIFDFVKSGQYDIGQTASYYYGGKDPDTLFFTSMPFSMTAQEQWAWFYHGGGLELANEVYAKHNIRVMLGGNTGMQMGGWFREEIKNVEDLNGLKMRIPGFAGKVIAGVGAVPTNIPAGELYQALERGTIDALEWVGPSLDLRMGFHKVAPYYYSGWHEPATELIYFFNEEKMASLPEWAQSILLNAAKLTSYNMSTATFDANAKNWKAIETEFPDVQIKQFPADVISALKESNAKLIESEKARSDVAKRIIESRENYLKTAREWTEIGEQLYLDSIVDQ